VWVEAIPNTGQECIGKEFKVLWINVYSEPQKPYEFSSFTVEKDV